MAEMRAAGIKDLEITFVGMAFIIHGTLKIISKAVKTCKEISKPTCMWIFMPWKVHEQNKVGEKIRGHFESIHKYNSQLLNAISIASYAVSLEQLENVLNASNMLDNQSMRNFWRTRIGIDKTKILMSELADSFLQETADFIAKSKTNRYHLNERILKQPEDPHVCLSRVLSQMWNGNGDDWASVFEVNNGTKKYGPKDNAVKATLVEMLEIENAFYSSITFMPLSIDEGM
jgi:hypothetical protein